MAKKTYTYGIGADIANVMPILLAFRWHNEPIECGAAFPGTGIWRGKTEQCTMVIVEWGESKQEKGAPRELARYLRDSLAQEAVSLSDGGGVEWV